MTENIIISVSVIQILLSVNACRI